MNKISLLDIIRHQSELLIQPLHGLLELLVSLLGIPDFDHLRFSAPIYELLRQQLIIVLNHCS
jgi:hypothetical protein